MPSWFGQAFAPVLTQIKADISALVSSVAGLSAQVTTLESDNTTINSDIANIESKIGNLTALQTDDKADLVAAINWLKNHSTAARVPFVSLSIAQMSGTVPYLVGAGWLPSGTYGAPEAEFGCADPVRSATVKLVKSDGSVLATMGGSAGGVAWRSAASGFSLVSDTYFDVILQADASDAVAYIRGLKIL